MTLREVADGISSRLVSLFTRNGEGARPCFGGRPIFERPAFRDATLFHEYFHGDTGRGVGASHQTGWTGLVAKLLMPRRRDADVHEPAAGGRARRGITDADSARATDRAAAAP